MLIRNNFMVIIAILCPMVCLFADPISVEVAPRRLIVIEDIDYAELAISDGPSGGDPIDANFEGDRGLVFYLQNGHSARIDYSSLIFSEDQNRYDDAMSLYGSNYYNSNFSISYSTRHISILRNRSSYSRFTIALPIDVYFVALVNDLIIYKTREFDDYLLTCVNPDNTWKIIQGIEALNYASAYGNGLSVQNGVIYYLDGPLRFPIDVIDDDGNQYNSLGVIVKGKVVYEISFPKDIEGYHTMFDPEGNFWAVGYTADSKGHPILYYAGRDWGYREEARMGVTTGNNLRLRLRSNTRAFVLESLPEGSPVTILKTGPFETIGGTRAPWYKIKTATGLIGWAWGGFIAVPNS